MSYIGRTPDPDDIDRAQAAAVTRQINRLRQRLHLDPRDPEALDEDEAELLTELEEWEP